MYSQYRVQIVLLLAKNCDSYLALDFANGALAALRAVFGTLPLSDFARITSFKRFSLSSSLSWPIIVHISADLSDVSHGGIGEVPFAQPGLHPAADRAERRLYRQPCSSQKIDHTGARSV